MTLSAENLSEIETLLQAPEANAQSLADLRRRFPGLSLTQCDASDLDAEEPFRQFQRFSLYLVDGLDHCWKITSDPSRATGLVVVQHRA
jgi:hypothetical protein